MRFYSCFTDLKVIHLKGTAVFKNGIYETSDKDIITELKKDKNIPKISIKNNLNPNERK